MTLTIADLTPRERELIELCMHESAHALAGVVLGGVLRAATVSGGLRHGDISGLTTFEPVPGFNEPQVAFAGVWAQARWRYDRRPTQRDIFAVLDGTGRGDDRVLSLAGGTAAGAGIVPLLERCFPAIRRVAAQLYRESAVKHGDVLAALGLTEDTAPMGLAAIRSGCRPGSFTITRPAA
jgi:hypothetical protein